MVKVFVTDIRWFQDKAVLEGVRSRLSPGRLEKADRCRFENGRLLSLGAGAALDFALRAEGLRERDAALGFREHGKPFLRDRPELFFNLSHSGGYALCALSDREVGADVERIRPVRDSLIRRVCTDPELALLPQDPEARRSRFFQLWTAKESFLKLSGDGLSLDPKSVEIQLDPPSALYLPETLRRAFLSWRELPGHWAAVCTGSPGPAEWRILSRRDLESLFESPV